MLMNQPRHMPDNEVWFQLPGMDPMRRAPACGGCCGYVPDFVQPRYDRKFQGHMTEQEVDSVLAGANEMLARLFGPITQRSKCILILFLAGFLVFIFGFMGTAFSNVDNQSCPQFDFECNKAANDAKFSRILSMFFAAMFLMIGFAVSAWLNACASQRALSAFFIECSDFLDRVNDQQAARTGVVWSLTHDTVLHIHHSQNHGSRMSSQQVPRLVARINGGGAIQGVAPVQQGMSLGGGGGGGGDAKEQLRQLKEMMQEGLIGADDYERKKDAILAGM